MNTSRKLAFEKLFNTRDLGGMTTRDGRVIADGKLIRSGHLCRASENDLKKIREKVGLIIDFRTNMEREENPNPEIEGIRYVHLPAFVSLTAGITRDEQSDQEALVMLTRDPEAARTYMMDIYRGIISDPTVRSQYSRFLHEVLENEDRAVLWHCTAGKDRAGMASVFVQELLGVPREAIEADYLLTNVYLENEVEGLMKMIGGQSPNGMTDEMQRAVRYLFGAAKDFLDAAYEEIEGEFGTVDQFLESGLGISGQERKQFRQKYLV